MHAKASGCSRGEDDAAFEQVRGGTPVTLTFEEFGASHVALDWPGRPIERESIQNGGDVCPASACEAYERSEPAGFCVHEPLAEIACTLSNDKAPEPLKQLVSGGETFISLQYII